MHDAGRVSRRKRTRDLRSDVENCSEPDSRVLHALAQGFAVDELHRDEVTCFSLACGRFYALPHGRATANFIDVRDVRVIERGGCPRLPLEAAQTIRVVYDARGQHLDRHIAVQLRIARAIDLAHSALAGLRAYSITA